MPALLRRTGPSWDPPRAPPRLRVRSQEKVPCVRFQVLFLNTEKAEKVEDTVMLKTSFLMWKAILYSSKIIFNLEKTKMFRKVRPPCSLQRPFSVSLQYARLSQPCLLSPLRPSKSALFLSPVPHGLLKGSAVPPQGFLGSVLVLRTSGHSPWLACWGS